MQTTTAPVIVERLYNNPVSIVWKAITDKNEMKKWYFDVPEFRAEVGCKFTFYGGRKDGVKYLHLCEVTEVVPMQKLTYSWKYDGSPGISFVTFELLEENNQTRLRLTHEGIHTFAQDNPDFAIQNFVNGWGSFINTSLVKYLESISVKE